MNITYQRGEKTANNRLRERKIERKKKERKKERKKETPIIVHKILIKTAAPRKALLYCGNTELASSGRWMSMTI